MKLATIERWAALFLLLMLFGLLVFSINLKSPTLDEQNHLARGLAYLRTGDLRLSQEHPPGLNVWEAWPLLLDPTVRLPLESTSWANAEWYGFADLLLWQANDHPQAMIFCTRVPVMWLTLIAAAVVFRWARTLGGVWGGLSALVLFVFDPNLLAHGRLTTTDMGITCLSLVATWLLWRALGKQGWRWWVWAGLAFGAAQLTKFSALVLGPVTALVVVLAWGRECIADQSFPGKALGRWAMRLAVLFGVGFAVVWAGYGMAWGPIAALGGLSGPAPAYGAGVKAILQRAGGGNPAFLMGQYSHEGWWAYFPIAFAIKTPLPTLILLALALGMWGRRLIATWVHRGTPFAPGNGGDRSAVAAQQSTVAGWQACLLLPVLAFWALALPSSFNIGYRHILPSLPFLHVLLGRLVGMWVNGSPRAGDAREGQQRVTPSDRGPALPAWARIAVGALLVWLVLGTVSIFPDYLTFFNAVAGGPAGGYRFLVDSNLDWGQDLPGLKRYAAAHGLERIYLSWFGAAHPEAYGLDFDPLPGFWRFGGDAAAYGLNPYAPAPGIYAISASNLQGVALAERDLYAWFRAQTPVAHVGHSILIYDVPERPADGGTVVLGVPMSALGDGERALLARGASVRQYDPATGMILPFALDASRVWFVAPELPGWGRLVRQEPEYLVFQAAFEPAHPRDPDARFGSFVRMLSHQVGTASLSREDALVVSVEWGVEQSPHRAAMSFAHLLDANGDYVAGWDGLTSPATCWQPGDRIRQTYRMPLLPSLAPGVYQVEVGWYDTHTMERWPCAIDGQHIGDRLLLEGVEIVP